jgi:hypothetical protein
VVKTHESDTAARFTAVTSRPLDPAAIRSLEEILEAVRAGRVSAFAIVVKENGWARWSSWRGKRSVDRYNLLGQLAALTAEIAATVNSE